MLQIRPMCVSTGQCPGFSKLDIWQLINTIRGEMSVEYAIVHPQLCVDDGDRFIKDYIKPKIKYVIGACDPKMQKKMFKDVFLEAGGNFEKQVIAFDLRNMETEKAINKVKEALSSLDEVRE